MNTSDSRLENYLAQFQPRSVRKLNIPQQHANMWPHRLAAAAVLTIGSALSIWFAYRVDTFLPQIVIVQPQPLVPPSPVKSIGALALTKLALEDSGEFDRYLLNQSRNFLPDPLVDRGSLRVLVTE